MMDVAQTIRIEYLHKQHWFKVYRYDTEQELVAALQKDKVDVPLVKISAHVEIYYKSENEECGRIYLLDKSVGSLARTAGHMAYAIVGRSGGYPESHEDDLCDIVGRITAKMYSQQRYF